MKKALSHWLLPLFLVLGLVGNASAGKDHGHGSTPPVTFSNFFIGEKGGDFGAVLDFKITSLANLVTLKVATIDLEDMTISVFNKKTGVSTGKSFSFDDFLDTSFSLNPGKYFAFFTGKISSDVALYAGVATAAPVPEPAEWMMILAGVAMMGFVVSRRRNNV